MARGAKGSVASAAQSFQNGGPPSTLAAKIVQHQSKPLEQQKPEGRELFGKLLQEYLTDPAVEEYDVGTSAKLIHVVAEAGLDSAAKVNPFALQQDLQQVQDCIAVIRLTVERAPSVLTFAAGDAASSPSLPVLLELLPRIISLCGKEHLAEVRGDFVGLLEHCMTATLRSTSSWHLADAIQTTVQTCVDGKSICQP
jgi:serine/threonine-protein kinase ATR